MGKINDAINNYSSSEKGLFYQLSGVKQFIQQHPMLLDELGLTLDDLNDPLKVLNAIKTKEEKKDD